MAVVPPAARQASTSHWFLMAAMYAWEDDRLFVGSTSRFVSNGYTKERYSYHHQIPLVLTFESGIFESRRKFVAESD